MKKTTDKWKGLFCSLLAAGVVILVSTYSFAWDTPLRGVGELGFAPIKEIGKDYLTTEAGKFMVTGETSIRNQDAEEIKLSSIKKSSSQASIGYERINGQLVALNIIIKPIDLPE